MNAAVVVVRDANEHRGKRPCKLFTHLAGIFECFPGHLQQQALLRIHPCCFSWRYAKERRIELIHVLNKCAPARDHFAGGGRKGIKEIIDLEAICGNFADCADSITE
ncbi:MAG: hypothetical protein ABSG46_11655 [Candidatus Binataceae bacterium]